MAQRHEIEAWVNPTDWEDPEAGKRAVEAILESGSEDEADWVRIVSAAEAGDVTEATLEAATRDYDRASERMDDARDKLYSEVRGAVAGGMSMYRAAQITGLSNRAVQKIMGR